jgi:membrane protein implicated in regulation of membrane protease activity
MLKSLLNLLAFVTFAIMALIGLFVAWWIAVFAALGLVIYVLVRRFIGRPVGPQGAVVIEGEYEVERERQSARPRVTIEQGRPGDN